MEAMKKVEMIRQKREAHFIHARQVKAIRFEREKDKREVARDMPVIRSAMAGLREKKPRKARVVVMKDAEDEDIFDDEMNGQSDLESDDEDEGQMMSDDDQESLLVN